MHIITEKSKPPDEIVSATESENNLREEVNRRTYKAGHTDRDGQPKISRNDGAGKGDGTRPYDPKKYDKNALRLFGESKLNVWPRDEAGNLIE